MTTNNKRVVDMDDTERRFLVIECGKSLIQNTEYFTDYTREVVENPIALRCIYEYLMKWDILKYVPEYQFQNARPISKFQIQSIHSNRPREWLFLEYLVYEHYKHHITNVIKINNSDLWKYYVSYCERNNYKITNMTSNKFHSTFNSKIKKTIDKNPTYIDAIYLKKSNGIRYTYIDKEKVIDYFKEFNLTDDEDDDDDEEDDE